MLIQNLRGAATPPFTVSFGVAHAGEGSLFADVLARADDALMTAKREGKNRTIITQNTPVPSRAVSAGAKEDNELLLPAA